MGVGGGNQVVGYKYLLGMHMVCTMGPVDFCYQIRVDKKTAWVGTSTGGRITINSPNLFGGDSGEGGITGAVDFLPGGPTQTKNDYLLSQLGDPLPAFRGVSSFVLRQVYLSNNPYLKPWAFGLSRIHIRQDGLAQWNDANAEIDTTFDGTLGTLLVADTGISSLGAGPTFDTAQKVEIHNLATTDVIVVTLLGTDGIFPAGSAFPSGPTWGASFAVSDANTKALINQFIGVAGVSSTTQALAGAALKGQQFTFTGHTDYAIWIPFSGDVTQTRGGVSASVSIKQALRDMNPAHILRECLTDPDWGMGYNEADIDDTSFTAAAATLVTEQMGMSLLWDTQTDIQEFITTVLTHIDGTCFVDRRSGLFVLKLIRNDYVLADLLELTENDIDQIQDFKRPQVGELVTSVTVQYWDNFSDTQGSVTVQDIALEQQQQAIINTTVQYPGFSNITLATRIAQRDLRSLSSQLASCTVYTDRTAKGLQVGSVFKLTFADYNLAAVPMRVNGIGYGDGKINRIRITCMEDVFSLDTALFIVKPQPVWVDPNGPAKIAKNQIAFEVPYYVLVRQTSQTTIDNELVTESSLGFAGVAIGRPIDGVINAPLYTDAGTGYVQLAVADFCPTGTIVEAMDRVQTVVDIQGTDEISLVTTGGWCQVDNEIMRIDAISSTSMTVARGCMDTLPAMHTALSEIYFWSVGNGSDPTQYTDSESLNLKVTPKTGSDIIDVTAATPMNLVMHSRAIRPYPPGNLKLNGSYFPAQVMGDIVLTWAHRDRTQQTGGTLLSFTDSSVGPETGVTYTLKVYNGANTLVRTVSGITGTTTTYTTAFELADGGPFTNFRMTLAAERGAFESFQIYDLSLSRSATLPATGVFIPDSDPVAKDPHIIGWNNSNFLVGIQGKANGVASQAIYSITDTGATPSYIGQIYDGRTVSSVAVPAPYEIPTLLMNQSQTIGGMDIYPLHANSINTTYTISYGRVDTTLDKKYRWLLNGDLTSINTIDTNIAIDADLVAMTKLASGTILAWSYDVAASPTIRAWSSTDGKVWLASGPCTNWAAPIAGNVNTMDKIFEVGTTLVKIGSAGTAGNSKINTAKDGLVWVDHAIESGTDLYNILDASYDGTALAVLTQCVPAPVYETHVMVDTPISYVDWVAGTTFGDHIDATRKLRLTPNAVPLSGWAIQFANALAVSPNVFTAGALLSTTTLPIDIGSIKALTGTYLESRTAGNSAINFLQGTTDFSIEVWAAQGTSAPAAHSEVVLFSQNAAGTPQFQNVLLTFKTVDNLLRLRTIRQTGTGTYATDVDCSATLGSNILASATGTHIVATRGTGGRVFLYINGSQVATTASGPITDLTVTGTNQLGCVWGNTNSQVNVLTGAATPTVSLIIDDAALYASELTSTRVLDHYNTGIADGSTHNRIWKSTAGSTWVKERDVKLEADFNFAGSGYVIRWANIVKFSTGFAVYGKDPASGFNSHVLLSTDHGATWGSATALITSASSLAHLQHKHMHSNSTRILATLTTRSVSGVDYPQFAYSTDGITFTDIDNTKFLPGSVGVNLIVLDDDNTSPRVTETGDFRITED